jgi:hypothetical protein
LFTDERDRARQTVHDRICEHVPEVLAYSDFLVLDQKLTLSVQPAVPVASGYDSYWPFRRDERQVIDLTLGVVLSEPKELEILGYVALPRWLTGADTFRFTGSSSRTDLFGHGDLGFLQHLL